MDRIIGKHIGIANGPMLIVIGAMHGNEPAGVEAIKMLFRELALEPYHNPNFKVYGAIMGVVGNVSAFQQNKRYINKDLNRCWTDENFALAYSDYSDDHPLANELAEMRQTIDAMKKFIEVYKPSDITVLDLHTTSSKGGIFSIASNDQRSINLGKALHAPVIQGMLDGLEGTSIHFFRGENLGIPTTAITFEAGQHLDILSPGRAYAAIVNCLKYIGIVNEQDVENRHDKILQEFSKDLPKVNYLAYKYSIPPDSHFVMKEGFVSFDEVYEGQELGLLNGEKVFSPMEGRILMPLYQSQGEEGFFIVKNAAIKLSKQKPLFGTVI